MGDLERAGLSWSDEVTLVSPRTTFAVVIDERTQELDSRPDRFVLVKTREMLEWYARRFADRPPATLLEVGIFKGGSVAFFEELWHPKRLLAVDLQPTPVDALDEYVRQVDGTDRVRSTYGTDQADAAAMRRAITEQFSAEPIDLVVDDACHFLPETRALFNAVFAFVRPGGTYVIEDWGWAHWPGIWQKDGGPWPDKPAMTGIALELCMLAASRPDLVASVEITSTFIIVTKGEAAEVPPGFDLSSSYWTAGRTFLEAGFPPAPGRGEAPAAAGNEAARIGKLEAELRALRSSTSWRVTEPMRRLGDYLRSRRRG